MRRINTIIIHFLIFNATIAQQINFKNLSIQDGLSQSTINCIYQDSQGYIWFGTQDGLNKYDGYNFTIFKENPVDTNSISHNWIWDVFEDKNGNLWIGTWYGLNKYNRNTNEFTRYLPKKNNKYSISNNRPISIKEDKNGNIYVATWGGGLNLFDPKTNQFYVYKHDPEKNYSIGSNFIRSIYIDNDGLLWIGTWNGLYFLNTNSTTIKDSIKFNRFIFESDGSDSVHTAKVVTIFENKKGELWIGTMASGLYRIDKTKTQVTHFVYDKNNPKSISSNNISDVNEDSFGKMWIGTQNSGLNLYNFGQNEFVHYKSSENKETNLSSNKISKLYEDKSGVFWIGTNTNGLNTINLKRKKFFCFSHSKDKKNSLSGNLVRCFYKDKQGFLWIGTEGNGLNRYDPNKKKFTHFRHNPENPYSISNDNIKAIVADKTGYLWIATSGGLNQFNPKTKKFIHFKHDAYNSQSISSNSIETLLIDNNNILWIGTSDKGLDKYDIKLNKFEHFRFDKQNPFSIPGNYILSLFEDHFGHLWIGGWGGGLSQYDAKNIRFIRFSHNPVDPNSICDDMISSIYETRHQGKSTLWVGTARGLSFMKNDNASLGKFNHYFEKDGLPNQHIYGVLEDKTGHLWISTNNGISKFTPPGLFENFDTGDGLLSNEFIGRSFYASPEGQLFYGCSMGFISFFPDSIKTSSYKAPVIITNFQLYNNNSAINNESEIHPYFQNPDTVRTMVLAYSDNIFTIEFAALDYTAPEKIKYAYKMEGFHNDWIYTDSKKRFATYTNLDPGNYIFRVKGTNSDGVWNEHGASMNIIITPPFWKTVWFKILIGLFIVTVLLFVHYLRIAFYKRENKSQEDFSNKLIESQETERKRIAGELHDSLGQNLLIINNSIKKYTRQVKNPNTDLELISTTIKDSIDEVREIAYNLHPQHLERLGLKEAIESVINRISQATDIKIVSNIEDVNDVIPSEYKIHFFRIIQEVLNNIVKHSNANAAEILVRKDNHHIYASVKDNGKGFKNENVNKMNGIGLRNISERAKLIGGDLKINSNMGQGTYLKLKVPCTLFSK